MVRLSGKSGLAWLLAAGLCLAPGQLAAQTAAPKSLAPATAAHQRKPHSSHKKAAVQPEVAPTPVIPPTLEQSPPTPPQVSYLNGQLTITALNATLGQVLRAVQSGTGASIELPSSAANERVVTRLGPGRATDVLNALLTGSKFNYIILGVNGSPGAVQKVILTTPKQGSNIANTAQNNPGQGTNQRQEEDVQEEEIQQAIGEEVQPAAPPPPTFRPTPPMGRRMPEGAIQPPNINNPNVNNADTNPNTGTKTPEQLLQELQQMQQQQQQMQDQLNPANRQPQQ